MTCIPLWIVGIILAIVAPTLVVRVVGINGLVVSGAAGVVLILVNALLPSLCLPL